MYFQALASGSNGNCSIFSSNDGGILIDAGISRSRIIQGLNELGINANHIKYVLITHAHWDHIRGLPVLMQDLKNAKVVASKETVEELKKQKRKDRRYLSIAKEAIPLNYNDSNNFDNYTITMFKADHDIAGSAAFGIQHEPTEYRMSYTTDTAFVNDKFKQFAKYSELIFMESNHEFSMLQYSKRPYWLKERINTTHLNNRQTMEILNEIVDELTQAVYLGHLSQECNDQDVVVKRITKLKEQSDFDQWEWVVATRYAKSSLTAINSALECNIKGGVTKNTYKQENVGLEDYFEEIEN